MTTVDVLTDEQLLDILENRIPALLERRPDLWKRIYSAWVDAFAKREEIAAIMEELRRLDNNLTAFQTSVNVRFDRVDERLNRTDERLDRVEQRLDRVEQRLDHVDERLAGVDERLAGVDERLAGLSQEVRDSRDWFELTTGRLQVRAGRNLEDLVAGALRIGLRRPDVSPDQIRLRQKIVDASGIVYKAGQQKEVDLLISNGEMIAFEVKSAARPDDVDDFADKVALLRHLNPDKKVRGIFITLAPESDVRQRCAELNIELAR